jgi:hypothetical protein
MSDEAMPIEEARMRCAIQRERYQEMIVRGFEVREKRGRLRDLRVMLEGEKRQWEVAMIRWDAPSMGIHWKHIDDLAHACRKLTREIREYDRWYEKNFLPTW